MFTKKIITLAIFSTLFCLKGICEVGGKDKYKEVITTEIAINGGIAIMTSCYGSGNITCPGAFANNENIDYEIFANIAEVNYSNGIYNTQFQVIGNPTIFYVSNIALKEDGFYEFTLTYLQDNVTTSN